MTPSSGADRPTPASGRAAFVSPETHIRALPGPFALEGGGALPALEIGYRTWGTLAPDGSNAVMVCHALTGSADADRWWTRMFGPGRALDPARDFIVCSNILGSCYGTTGPASLEPASGTPWRGSFPKVTVRDMVRAQHALLGALGVRRLRLVIGGSLGGMQVLEWSLLYPELVDAAVFIASTARHSAWAIGLSEAQRQAVFADPRWRGGAYDPADPPSAGLAAARMAAMLTYRSARSMEQRFGRRQQTEELFSVQSYLRYQGEQLVDRFDPATYVTLLDAMDSHDVARGRGDLDDVLRSIQLPMLVVSIDTDVLYWPWEQREVARLVPHAKLAVLDSVHGHDAFLIDVDRLSDMVAEFRGLPASTGPGAAEQAFAEEGVSLLVVGKGKVGSEVLEQLRVQRGELERDHDVSLRVVGLADRHGAVFAPEGLDLDRWREVLAGAATSGPLDARSAPPLLDRLARLPRPVLVDVTAADGMDEVYAQAFRRGIDVVTSNKRPLAVGPRALEAVRYERRAHHRHLHYDAAVGASLPVIGTLRRLVQGGDRIVAVEGALSGTLGYVMSELSRGVALSLAVRWAIGLGHAEADPRDDLSGLDTARKALILARELGADLALEDVRVEPLVPRALLVDGGSDALIAALRGHDQAMAARVEALAREGRVLRYLATLTTTPDGRTLVRAGPVAVGEGDPAARLVGVEAMVAFTTARHSERPLVVQGAGVGAASTAGTLIADVLRGIGAGAR